MRFQVVADSGSGPVHHRHPDHAGRRRLTPTRARGGIDTMSLTPEMAVAKRSSGSSGKNGQWTINGVTWDDVEEVRVHQALRQPAALRRRAVDHHQRVRRLVPPGTHPPDRRQDHRPEHQRRQTVRLGERPQGRLLRRRERVRHPADAVRHRSPGGRAVHGPLPQPGRTRTTT